MASSSTPRRRGAGSFLLFAALAMLLPGCWTGAVYQSGRLHESVTGYSWAATDGTSLRLGYEVAIAAADGSSLGSAPRAVDLRLEDLAAFSEIPVDVFPARAEPPDAAPRPDETRVPIVAGGEDASAGDATDPRRSAAPLVLRVREGDGVVDGFDLYASRPNGATPEHVGGLFADALYRSRSAWWVYPCLPFAAALDLVLLPLQLVTSPPLLLIGR